MVPRNKSIPVKSVTIHVEAFSHAGSGLIPAFIWVTAWRLQQQKA